MGHDFTFPIISSKVYLGIALNSKLIKYFINAVLILLFSWFNSSFSLIIFTAYFSYILINFLFNHFSIFMGNCSCSKASENFDTFSYSESVSIKIKERDYSGRITHNEKVDFKVTSPVYQHSQEIQLSPYKFFISGCVLPGLDPRGMMEKECQDNLFFIEKEGSILAALFDGHGREGLKVVEFCNKFMKEYFKNNASDFKAHPKEALDSIIEECDHALSQPSSKVDPLISGTTAVVMYIDETGLYVASVGDSRAILATVPKKNEEVQQPPRVDKNNLYKRFVEPSRILNPLALTVDQKPNHQEELERIQKAGGKVQQLTDDRGNKVGPFRVWKKNGTLPGLAMSRSIGDGIGKECGVIATPIFHSFQLFPGKDQFIVAGSDGVWDVMENIEVANFVDKFRGRSTKTVRKETIYPISPENSSIAHLLAEESRYRWYGICEDEDVMIDDISVIVIEINSLMPSSSLSNLDVEDRRTLRLNSVGNIPTESTQMQPGTLRGDAVRGSFIPAKDPNAKKKRVDPKRGSYLPAGQEEESHETLDGVPFVDEENKQQ
ncbi:unnamed protein product [Blepharisma stoltei]|uniref:PPM-type phosphatase domain-containing protein n=1 Tax=Blepharisma stoltei TaxID=1481888 RepID=A0AAU9IRQ5_9CILI|nr:unnamed protein product [Blepharisma stoltei]